MQIKKNIAIVITRLDLGGAQKVALYLAQNLSRKKYNVHFIAGKGGYLDEEIETRYPKPDTRFQLWGEITHPINPVLDTIAVFKLAKYFKENNIEIVHTHSSKAGIIGRLAAKMAGVPAIVHTIHGFPFHKYQDPIMHSIYWIIEKIFSGITTRFIAVGRDVMEYGLKKGIGKKEQYVIIRPGVELKAFKGGGRIRLRQGFGGHGAEGGRFLKKYGLKPGVFTVGMIGNCKKQKNPMGFAGIAKLVLAEKPDAQFIFAGDGPLKADAEAFLDERGIKDRVKFIGWTDEPETFIKAIDLFLLTSLWEGIPCTLAQAAVAGKPAVASNIEGNREFMEAIGASEFLYAPRDYKAAAGLITALIWDKCRGYKAKPGKILKEFDSKYMLKQHEKLYGSL